VLSKRDHKHIGPIKQCEVAAVILLHPPPPPPPKKKKQKRKRARTPIKKDRERERDLLYPRHTEQLSASWYTWKNGYRFCEKQVSNTGTTKGYM